MTGGARRRLAAEDEARILAAVEAARDRGEASPLLRREGLYWSHVAAWRRQRQAGRLGELDACAARGGRTAILEREDLLWSDVAKWRSQREVGTLDESWMELSTQARLLQLAQERDALLDEIDPLRLENVELRRKAASSPLSQRVRDGFARLLGRRAGPLPEEPGESGP